MAGLAFRRCFTSFGWPPICVKQAAGATDNFGILIGAATHWLNKRMGIPRPRGWKAFHSEFDIPSLRLRRIVFFKIADPSRTLEVDRYRSFSLRFFFAIKTLFQKVLSLP
jgi:hypothetical protein